MAAHTVIHRELYADALIHNATFKTIDAVVAHTFQ